MVFTNEMGFTFFRLWISLPTADSKSIVILPQMNKEALIRTLRKDFELLLFRNMDSNKYYALKDIGMLYHAFPQADGVNYYITDINCSQLVKMQRASTKKAVMEATIYGNSPENAPDSISIRHFNISHFSITLKKISALAAQ